MDEGGLALSSRLPIGGRPMTQRKQQDEPREDEFLYAEDEVQAATMVARLLTEGVRDVPCGPLEDP